MAGAAGFYSYCVRTCFGPRSELPNSVTTVDQVVYRLFLFGYWTIAVQHVYKIY